MFINLKTIFVAVALSGVAAQSGSSDLSIAQSTFEPARAEYGDTVPSKLVAQIWQAVQQKKYKNLGDLLSKNLTQEELTHGLVAASTHPDVKALRILLQAGADPNSLNGYPLRAVSAYDCLPCVKVLLDAGADIHANDDAALYYAAIRGRYHVVNFLLKAGGNPNARGIDGLYKLALQNGHLSTAKLLKGSESLQPHAR